MIKLTIPQSSITRMLSAVLMAIFFAAVLAPTSYASDALNTMKPLNRTSPNTVIMHHDGTAQAFSDLADRPILVNFWASWCPPCIHELPDLAVLDKALGADGMAVVLVGVDRKGRDFGEDFLARKGITIPTRVYDMTGDLSRAVEIKVMPTSFIILPGGQMVGRIEGPLDWSSPQVIAAVRAALTP